MPEPLIGDDPRSLGAYTLTGRIGAGEQGVVFLGRDRSGSGVAVKLLAAELESGPESRQQFLEQIGLAEQVRSPCVAAILDADVVDEHPFVVSAYVEGPSLQQAVAEMGPLHEEVLHRLARGTLQGLAAVHRLGIVHGDLKPSNIILGPTGPSIVDFAVMTALDRSAAWRTRTRQAPDYMAPEQFASDAQVGVRADLFAWAGALTYAATGRAPFGSDAPRMLMISQITGADPDIEGVPDSLRALLTSCLRKDPAARPTLTEVLEQLPGQEAEPSSEQSAAATPDTPPSFEPPPPGPASPATAPAPEPSGAPAAEPPPWVPPEARPVSPAAQVPRQEWISDVDLALEDEPRRRRPLWIALVVVAVLVVGAVAAFVVRPFRQPSTVTPTPQSSSEQQPAERTDQATDRTPGPSDEPTTGSTTGSAGRPTRDQRPSPGTSLPGADSTRLLSTLDGTVTLTAYEAGDIVRVWNPRTRTFDRTDFGGEPRVSPDGRWLAALTRDGEEVVIVDRTSGRARRIPASRLPRSDPDRMPHLSLPLWSPDSQRFLLHVSEQTDGAARPSGFVIIDTGGADPRFVPLPEHRFVVWNVDGTGFLANPTSDSRRPDIHILDSGGNQVDTIPEAGWLTDDGHGTFSPSGTRMVTYCSKSAEQPRACIYDARTKKQLTTVAFDHRAYARDVSLLGWYDEKQLISDVALPGGRGFGTGVVDLDGTITTGLLRKGGPISSWFVASPA